MTRERDRIQENANKYIVKNCPTTYLNFEDKYVCTSQIKEKGFPFYCQDCTDCVIKQVIEKCKQAPILDADWVLKLFDIEEINK